MCYISEQHSMTEAPVNTVPPALSCLYIYMHACMQSHAQTDKDILVQKAYMCKIRPHTSGFNLSHFVSLFPFLSHFLCTLNMNHQGQSEKERPI